MKKDRIEINKSMIPYVFSISLPDELYQVEVNYNKRGGFFTAALYKGGTLICAGDPIVYGAELFADVYKPGLFPALRIVPMDETKEFSEVTWDNFNETVFLTIDNEG